MINTLIAYDDQDFDLGEYFESSHTDILGIISQINVISNNSITGLDCTVQNINTTVQNLNGVKFVFIALSHGNEEEHVANEVFVSNDNSASFKGSLFYSCACSTGSILGNILIDAGCLAFIGYSDTVFVIEDYYSIFYICQNFAIKSFLTNVELLEVSFNKMVNHYNQEIDRLIAGSIDDVIAASSLVNNKECLVLLGGDTGKGLTQRDFNTNWL